MPEAARPRHSRRHFWTRLTIGLLVLSMFVGAAWYLRSERFENLLRSKIIAYLETATNGRVEIGRLQWNLAKWEVEIHGVTIHGRENATELPFAHVDRLYARVRIISIAEARVTLRDLSLTHPVIHLIVYPDGTTNAPEFRAQPQSSKSPIEQLFDLAIRRADLRRGLLVINQQQIPFDFSANDVDARMVYDRRAQRYDAELQVGRFVAKYQDWREVAASATANLSLTSNAVQLNSLKLSSQGSSIETSGKLTDFNHPQIQLSYNSTLDLAQLGSVIRSYNLRGGTLILDGSGNYSAPNYNSTGRVAIRGFNYTGQGLDLRNANLNSNFTVDRNRITLTRAASRLLGGEVAGDAEVVNYAPSASSELVKTTTQPQGKTRGVARANPGNASPVQKGSAHLRVTGISLSEVARMLSTKAMPYSSLRPSGSVGGTVNLNWTGSFSRANADLALDVKPPAQPSPGELPVTASLRGQYSNLADSMTLSMVSITTPRTELNGSGLLGPRSVALKLSVSTTNLTEFQPLLTALGNAPPPLTLAGQASFNGTITGRLQQPQIAGHVQATDFTYIYTPAAPAPPPSAIPAHPKSSFFHRAAAAPETHPPPLPQPHNIHIDFFSGDIQYSASGVSVQRAVVHQGDATVNIDGFATLSNGSFTDHSPFDLQATLHNADITSLQRTMGVDYPVSGIVNLTVQASGTQANPQGHGHISLSGGEAYGRPVTSLASDIVFANHEAQFRDIHLQALRGVVQGTAAVNLSNKTLHFDVTGHSVDLASLPELQSTRFTTTGVANFAAKGSGPWDAPEIDAHLELANLVLNGEIAGGLLADAITRGSKLQIKARSRFPHATLTVDGDIELRGDMPSDLNLRFQQLDIDPFLHAELRGRITGHSSMGGEAHLAGPLRQPRKLDGTLKIDAFNVEIEKIPVASAGPVELSMQNQVIAVQRCTLVSDDSRFTLAGSVDLKGDQLLDLRANGHVNVKLAQTLDPELTAYGFTDADLKIQGTFAKPVMTGRIQVSKVGLSMIDLPAGLADLNGSFVFHENRLEVEKLTGRTGGGLVSFAGDVTFGRTIGFDLTAEGTEIRFRYSGISVTSDQSLRLDGTLQSASLTGDITVTRFAQIPNADLTLALARSTQAVQIPDPKSPLNNLHLDLRILSAPELTVQTTLAKLSGDVDLRLRGTPIRPVLLGRINIAEGDINLNGAKYHLERGDVTFSDPVRIDPILDVEATTHVRDYDITIGLHGTIEKLNTTYRSDPPLSSDDIIALLAFGRTQAEGSNGGTTTIPQVGFAESASNAILGQAINATVTNRVSKLFGVSSIKINPAVGGPDNNPNARLTVQQQVANNITLTYITNLTQAAQQVIQFEYNINPQYTIVGTRDENGVVSFDLLIRQRKK